MIMSNENRSDNEKFNLNNTEEVKQEKDTIEISEEAEQEARKEQQAEAETEQLNQELNDNDTAETSEAGAAGEGSEKDQIIENLQQELSQAKDALLRKAAELDNVRKRVQRERNQVFETARAKAVEDFLPVNDDIRRTLNAAEGLEIDPQFMDGVKMIAGKFEDVLKKYNVERIDQTDVPFDVDLHDAMMRQKVDGKESDMVVQVIENGYRMGDRTIRHAKVIVSE